MARMEIKRDDIVGLGDALDRLKLPEGQKALLSTIVSIASESLRSRSAQAEVVEGRNAARSFREQFAESFTPGRTGGDDGSGLKIGHNPG